MLDERRLVEEALLEDSLYGDITTRSLEIEGNGRFVVHAREDLVLCGTHIFEMVFRHLEPSIEVKFNFSDGQEVCPGVIGEVRGPISPILRGERVALNFLQRLSGIATMTRKFVNRVRGTGVRILDTRKTTPLYRNLEKMAVRCGGGHNHRLTLYDGILIKDNHIRAVGGVGEAVKRAIRNRPYGKMITVEVESIEEMEEAIEEGADIVMLDNFPIEDIRKAVQIAGGRVKLEVSGGVNLDNVREIAEAGVDFISIGALTHSARWVDISMELVEAEG